MNSHQLAAITQRPPNGFGNQKWEPAKPPPKSAWASKKAEKIDFEEEEDPCVICHEEMNKNIVTLRCGHKFHPYVSSSSTSVYFRSIA